MNGETLSFNRDSDQYAWNFYKEFYRGTLLDERYYIGEPRTRTGETPSCKAGELFAFTKFTGDAMDEPCDNPESYQTIKDPEKVRGNCDFNFNEGKRFRLKCIVEADAECSENDKEKLQIRIKNMESESLKQINVSLMLSTGNLQGVQGKGLAISCEDIDAAPYEFLDRPDTLVYNISTFYSNHKKWKETYENMREYDAKQGCGISKGNAQALEFYLGLFGDVYCYCNETYGIGADLTDALIESGKRPLNSAKRVSDYIALAERFWEERRKSERSEKAIDAMCGPKKLSL